jgi:hypothetical protein
MTPLYFSGADLRIVGALPTGDINSPVGYPQPANKNSQENDMSRDVIGAVAELAGTLRQAVTFLQRRDEQCIHTS